MSDRAFYIFAGLLMISAIAMSAWWSLSIWDECRESGRSVMYCMRMVWR